ncbi:MAG: hypothetical protein K6B52_05625 [Clostridiales bacterium]|nr:hypothetical protein [Clostridiales bacterium]
MIDSIVFDGERKKEFETTDTDGYRNTMRKKRLANEDLDTIRDTEGFKAIICMLSY